MTRSQSPINIRTSQRWVDRSRNSRLSLGVSASAMSLPVIASLYRPSSSYAIVRNECPNVSRGLRTVMITASSSIFSYFREA